MKNSNNIFKGWEAIFIALIVSNILTPLFYWHLHPERSETQIFTEFWWMYVCAALVIAVYPLGNRCSRKTGVPKMQDPPPPPDKKTSIKEIYEFLETRAMTKENLQDPRLSCPLWVSIDELYHVLSFYHHGDFKMFLKETGWCYDDGYGCDADDFDLPKFPAEKLKSDA